MVKSDESYLNRLEQEKQNNVAQLLLKTGRLVNQIGIERVKKELNLPQIRQAHMNLLPHLEFEGIQLTLLAKKIGHTKQVVGRLVDEMVGMGFLVRCDDPNDKRSKQILFSEEGKQWMLKGLDILKGVEKEISDIIGESELKKLQTLLLPISKHLQKIDTEVQSQ